MRYLFVAEGMADPPSIAAAVDSTLIKSKVSIWHKSSMKKGIVLLCCMIPIIFDFTIHFV